ncbi:hypothetical protein DPMN_107871 [Dreissena polymorpha]|uniref:Uncharacterized protein n=1 Tax=Dreissena polymorpha TaxID=45954 RepID=A0A9D4QLG3_DREPO|nr:hypothetical protein DPMN_107871 [Dreissena polymorpha]
MVKNASDPDMSYYETYLKQYPLNYQAVDDDEQKVHNTSLCDCYVILFMDNLLRLSVHEDLDPGKSLTSQICILPIILKGLPKDHKLMNSWQSEDCKEKALTDSCSCM